MTDIDVTIYDDTISISSDAYHICCVNIDDKEIIVFSHAYDHVEQHGDIIAKFHKNDKQRNVNTDTYVFKLYEAGVDYEDNRYPAKNENIVWKKKG